MRNLHSRPKRKQTENCERRKKELSFFVCMKETPTEMDRQDADVSDLHTPPQPLMESNMKESQRSDDDKKQQSRHTDKKNNKQSSSSKTRRCDGNRAVLLMAGLPSRRTAEDVGKEPALASDVMPEDSGRERLKRHRVEVAGRVWIPDIWGQEELLKDLIDCSAFDSSLVPAGIMPARAALVEEGRRANSSGLRIENRC